MPCDNQSAVGDLKAVPQALLRISKVHERIQLPCYESEGAAGMDMRAFLDSDLSVSPMGRVKIPTGLKIEIPQGFEGQIRPRSGLAARYGLTVLNSPGTVDSDYRGEIEIILINLGEKDVTVKDGDRIAQLVIAPVCRAELLEAETLFSTKRGSGGFGSTGV
ncbi:MAG: dUTP diphosphatase [Treponema sp.]|jgi:dUTP pyrophosphatase|nr:dUTP diphosphatase [Treponema sp.]